MPHTLPKYALWVLKYIYICTSIEWCHSCTPNDSQPQTRKRKRVCVCVCVCEASLHEMLYVSHIASSASFRGPHAHASRTHLFFFLQGTDEHGSHAAPSGSADMKCQFEIYTYQSRRVWGPCTLLGRIHMDACIDIHGNTNLHTCLTQRVFVQVVSLPQCPSCNMLNTSMGGGRPMSCYRVLALVALATTFAVSFQSHYLEHRPGEPAVASCYHLDTSLTAHLTGPWRPLNNGFHNTTVNKQPHMATASTSTNTTLQCHLIWPSLRPTDAYRSTEQSVLMLDHVRAVHNSHKFSRLLASYDDRWAL